MNDGARSGLLLSCGGPLLFDGSRMVLLLGSLEALKNFWCERVLDCGHSFLWGENGKGLDSVDQYDSGFGLWMLRVFIGELIFREAFGRIQMRNFG